MKKKSRVAIIGRVNVGKSTLFNRLTSGPKALVSDDAGTTRDRKEGECYWRGKAFTIVDTGGLYHDTRNPIEQKVSQQALYATEKSDAILFVVDAHAGITQADKDIARLLKQSSKKPIMLVANKIDSGKDMNLASEFYTLGFDKPWPVSAASGLGTGDLLDELTTRIKLTTTDDEEEIKVAIIGKPNVGKSSLVNALVGEERSIVHDEPYTTRDANTIPLMYEGQRITLIDTAGVRRKTKIDPGSIEKESVTQSLDSIHKADVVVMVTEADKPITAQDRQLAQLIYDSKAAVVIIGNKWDLIDNKDAEKVNEFTNYYRGALNFLSWAPVIFMSAKDKTKLTRLKQTIVTVNKEKFRKIDDNALAKFMKSVIRQKTPTIGKGMKRPYIYRVRQIGVNPPQFVVEIKEGAHLLYSYLNIIEKRLREKFGFEGSPIKMWIEKIAPVKKK